MYIYNRSRELGRTPGLHHKIRVPTGPTLGKFYSITCQPVNPIESIHTGQPYRKYVNRSTL